MKAVPTFAIFGLLCFPLITLGAEDPPAAAPKASDVAIAIEGSDITVQGKKLTIPFDLSELTSRLGPGDRVSKLFNWITTWDDLGVIAYCKPDTTKVISVAVCLAKKEYKFSPKTLFAGKISVDGAEITASSNIKEINEKKSGNKLAEKIAGLPWSIDYPAALVTVGEEKKDGKAIGMDQVAISWKEPKKKEGE